MTNNKFDTATYVFVQIKQKERKLTEGREPPGRVGGCGDPLTPHVRKPTGCQAFVPTANSHKRAVHFHGATPHTTLSDTAAHNL